MKRILMILTSHRLDCLRLCVDSLAATGSFEKFDRVVWLLNGVTGKHLKYVQDLVRARPRVAWDIIAGPRGRGERISGLQNECVRRYPESLYFKIDEDTFISANWVEKLMRAYETHADDLALSLITPVIPNNGAGFFFLLNAFPELADEYHRLFPHPLTPDCDGPVWRFPKVAEWITRKFLSLSEANRRLEERGAAAGATPYTQFAYRFSINCIVYGYRHWAEMGGIGKDDEINWSQWIQQHGKYVVLATDTLVHHYSFFVQQEWLDRTSLLEDMRRFNLPGTTPSRPAAELQRLARILKQIPGILRRRLGGAT